MSLKPQTIPEIPLETVRVVRAAFPKGNIYIHLRDTLGTIYQTVGNLPTRLGVWRWSRSFSS